MPSSTVWSRLTAILAAELRGVLQRTWNSERPLIFTHVALTKTLGARWDREIRAQITSRMDLWDRGLHSGLVGDTESEGSAREGRAASGGEQKDEAVARRYHDMVLSGKLRQAVCRATDRKGGACLLPDDQCMKTGRPVAVVLRDKHPDMQVHVRSL